jgi:hypothetical protein
MRVLASNRSKVFFPGLLEAEVTKFGVICVGAFLFTLGTTGLVLLQTGVIQIPGGTSQGPLEMQAQENGPEGSSQQAEQGEKQAVQGEKRQLPSVQEKVAQAPESPAQNGNVAPEANASPEKPVPVPGVGSGSRQYPKTQELTQSEQQGPAKSVVGGAEKPAGPKPQTYARNPAGPPKGTPPQVVTGKQPLVVRFEFDPRRNHEIRVARVHFGDRVVVKVRRVGDADHEVYLGFGLPDSYETRSYRGWSVGGGEEVITPIRDSDQLILSAGDKYGPWLTSRLDSRNGEVLRIGTRPPGYLRTRYSRYDHGYYEIEMRIYPDNRWNIRPRSLL